MSCCLIDFRNLVSTAQGVATLRGEWRDLTGKPPVGNCRSSLYEMYCYIATKKDINILKTKTIMNLNNYTYKVKEGSEILYIAGTRTDIREWEQEQIIEYLIKYPKADGHFEKTQRDVVKEINNNVIDLNSKEIQDVIKIVKSTKKNK